MPLVNTSSNQDYSGTGSSTPFSSAFAVTAGNLVVVSIRYFGAVTIDAVVDSAGHVYNAVDLIVSASGERLAMYYRVISFSDASDVITFTLSGGAQYWGICTEQWSGNTATPFDTGAVGDGESTTNAVTTASFNTANADEVVIACAQVAAASATWTPDTGYSLDVQDSLNVLMMSSKVYSSTQTGLTVTNTSTDSSRKTIIAAGFELSGSGGGGGNPWYAYAQMRQRQPKVQRTWQRRGALWTPNYHVKRAA